MCAPTLFGVVSKSNHLLGIFYFGTHQFPVASLLSNFDSTRCRRVEPNSTHLCCVVCCYAVSGRVLRLDVSCLVPRGGPTPVDMSGPQVPLQSQEAAQFELVCFVSVSKGPS